MSEQTAATQNTLNGVNVDQLFENIELINEENELAKFKFLVLSICFNLSVILLPHLRCS